MPVLWELEVSLLQEIKDGVDHPISYFLCKFNRDQQFYPTIEKQRLALPLELQHFEV